MVEPAPHLKNMRSRQIGSWNPKFGGWTSRIFGVASCHHLESCGGGECFASQVIPSPFNYDPSDVLCPKICQAPKSHRKTQRPKLLVQQEDGDEGEKPPNPEAATAELGGLGWWFGILGIPLGNNPFYMIDICFYHIYKKFWYYCWWQPEIPKPTTVWM